MSASSKERVETTAPQARPQGAASVLDFGQTEVEPAGEALSEAFDLQQILASVRETAYRWDFATDRIEWAANADDVLGIADKAKIDRGRAFALLVDAEQAGARYDGITGGPHVAANTERRYCLRYRLLPEGRRGRASLWVEDTGIRRINADGHPSVAQGTLKVINDRREKEERLLFLGSHDDLTGQLNRTRLTEELTRFSGQRSPGPGQRRFPARRRQRSHAGQRDLWLRRRRRGDSPLSGAASAGRCAARIARPLLVQQVRNRADRLQRGRRRGDRPAPDGDDPRQRDRYQRWCGGD